MRKPLKMGLTIAVVVGFVACKENPVPAPEPPSAPKPGWEYTPQDFGIGRKHTANATCNREIDQILGETLNCFNTRSPQACEALQKQNSAKIGAYIRSLRCAK